MKFENSKISEIQSETGKDPFQKRVPAIQFQSETGRTTGPKDPWIPIWNWQEVLFT